MSTTQVPKTCEREVGALHVVTFTHPQGCRSYVLANRDAKRALVVDAHLDLVGDIAGHVRERSLNVKWVADTHTHADTLPNLKNPEKTLAQFAGETKKIPMIKQKLSTIATFAVMMTWSVL